MSVLKASAFSLFAASFVSAQVGWTELHPTKSPPRRTEGAMVFDPNRRVIVLFGGWGGFPGGPLADTWEFDGSIWHERVPSTTPAPRNEHSMVYDHVLRKVLLFGGQGFAGALSDTWTWDGTDWTQRFPKTVPPRREFAAMTYDEVRHRAVLFGGDSPVIGALSDTWEWDGSNWTMLSPRTTPSARDRHSLTYDPRRLRSLLFGGRAVGSGPTEVAADTWEWDGTDWVQRFPITNPPPRREHAAAFVGLSANIVLFGGLTASTAGRELLSDTWDWDGLDWHLTATSGPAPRSGHTIAYDSVRGLAILFGGIDSTGTILFDTWQYFAGSPSSFSTFGAGCSGTAGTPTLAPSAESLPWVGETFSIQLTSLPPTILNTPFGLLGTSNKQWLGLPLPASLGVIGAPGCDIHVSLDAVFQLLNTGGSAMWTIPIPALPALSGGTFYVQGLVLDSRANPLGATLTNAGEATIGIR